MKRDEGSIYKTPDGRRWFARLRYTDAAGNAREKKRTCPTHSLAKAAISDLKLEIEDDARERRTYAQLDAFYRKEYVHAARFVGGQKITGFRQNLKVVEHYLDAAKGFFADQFVEDIGYPDLENFKKSIANKRTIHDKPRSVADVNQHLRRLRRVLNVAIEQGWLVINPFKKGRSLISESFETERTRTLTAAEEMRLLAKCTGKRKHLAPIIIFAIETGVRRGELLAVRWSAVDLKRRVITIAGTSTKTLKARLVPVSSRLAETLAQLRQNQLRPNSLVFGGTDFKKSFIGARTDAKLADVHFHDLRHTAITRMLEKGISPPLVMKISGHTQQKTFMRYVNQSETSVYEIAMLLDRAAA